MANDSQIPPFANGNPAIVGFDGTDQHYIRTDTSGRLLTGLGITSLSTVSTLTQIAMTTTSQVLLAANAGRKGGMLFNNSSVAAYVGLSTVAVSTSAYSVTVAVGGLFELPPPAIYSGGINVISSAAASTNSVMVTELS